MTTRRNSKWLLLGSLLLLLVTLGGVITTASSWFGGRATRWGDSLVVGPRFSGDVNLPGNTDKMRVSWEEGSPVVDAPSWKGRGPITMTFFWGFVIYHLPPGTLDGKQAARETR